MHRLIILLTGLLLAGTLSGQTATKEISGQWVNEDQTRVIEFVRNGDAYDAIIRKADAPQLVDKKQISGLEETKDAVFSNGTLYIIQKGRTAKCSARLINDNKLKLTASIGLLSRSQTWTRLEP
ncbi:MAG: DUF2147 domain-containing protein [Saprospiraceae bacterium]|nr:DUF2147 domain-containing protein [Lewinella sp.]